MLSTLTLLLDCVSGIFHMQHILIGMFTLALKDHEARDQCLITLLHSLPLPHFHTAVYIFEHLKR